MDLHKTKWTGNMVRKNLLNLDADPVKGVDPGNLIKALADIFTVLTEFLFYLVVSTLVT